jgi:phenylalanine-4-hydroxylase
MKKLKLKGESLKKLNALREAFELRIKRKKEYEAAVVFTEKAGHDFWNTVYKEHDEVTPSECWTYDLCKKIIYGGRKYE